MRGRLRLLSASLAALALGLTLPLVLGGVPAEAARRAAAPYDVDGDGRPELVVGAPGLTVSGHVGAGGVVVLRPTTSKEPTARDATRLTQSSAKVDGSSETDDHLGAAVASADFDRDGYADLAVGLPGEDFSGKPDAGAVTILYGSHTGLTGRRSVQVSEPTGKVTRAGFGTALAAGDVTGDGYPDVVVGAPGDGTGGPGRGNGTVTVLPGGPKGVRVADEILLLGRRGTTGPDLRFGALVAVADVDGDRAPDVVVTSQSEDAAGTSTGAVSFCSGGAGRPSGCARLVSGRDLDLSAALAVGDLVGDDRPELVLGVPRDDIDSSDGALVVLRLSGSGEETEADGTRLEQDDLGLGSPSDLGDRFGAALAVGQVAGDAHDDLVVGAPGALVGNASSGRVFLVRGGPSVLTGNAGSQAWDQSTRGISGSSEAGDRFGGAVTLVDRNRDGRLDLVVGSPGEDGDRGRVTTVRGNGRGYTATGSGAFGPGDVGVTKSGKAELGRTLGR